MQFSRLPRHSLQQEHCCNDNVRILFSAPADHACVGVDQCTLVFLSQRIIVSLAICDEWSPGKTKQVVFFQESKESYIHPYDVYFDAPRLQSCDKSLIHHGRHLRDTCTGTMP